MALRSAASIRCAYIEDHEFVSGSGDLGVHNGRFCVTPEYPAGIYAYFITLNESLTPAFPYVIGPTYYGTVPSGNTGPGSGPNSIPGNAVQYLYGTTLISEVTSVRTDAFPVPTSAMVQLRSAVEMTASIELFDASGRLVLSVSPLSHTAQIDLSALSSGSYTARLRHIDGSSSAVRVARE